MRWTLGFLSLLATPAFAAGPRCAVPRPTAMSRVPAVVSKSGDLASARPPAQRHRTAVPASLRDLAFARHVAAAGARITSLGKIHALRVMAAQHSGEFMIFEITADGKAGVSGVPIDLSLAQLRSVAGDNITDLGVEHGLHGYFVRSGKRFQVFYATPDGKGLIPGVMWDAAGKDVTRQQVSKIPGAIPTVEVGSVSGKQVGAAGALPLLRKTTYGTIGPAGAPKVYMFMDPQCVYSIRTFQALRPYAKAGRLQLAVIPLSVLDYEDHGQSTQSALALLSDAPDRIVSAWRSGSENNAPSADASALLRKNMKIAEAVGLKGTPMLWWRKPDGSEAHLNGMPANVAQFVADLGS